jgi:hypothetical protein
MPKMGSFLLTWIHLHFPFSLIHLSSIYIHLPSNCLDFSYNDRGSIWNIVMWPKSCMVEQPIISLINYINIMKYIYFMNLIIEKYVGCVYLQIKCNQDRVFQS